MSSLDRMQESLGKDVVFVIGERYDRYDLYDVIGKYGRAVLEIPTGTDEPFEAGDVLVDGEIVPSEIVAVQQIEMALGL